LPRVRAKNFPLGVASELNIKEFGVYRMCSKSVYACLVCWIF